MTKKKSAADTTQETQEFPLFFSKPAALDLARHGKAGISPSQDLSFTSATNSVPVNVIEFVEASKFFPIVFTQEETPSPVAVLGLEKANYYVDAKGQWESGTYIPAYIRKYPFAFVDVSERKQLVLCVDEASSFYREEAGASDERFYGADDKPSALSQNALEFCTAYHNHYLITKQFCEALKKHDLFAQNQSDVVLKNGRKITLGGFQLIDEKKLSELPDEVYLEFRRQGFIPFIYFALAASSNWKNLAERANFLENSAAA